MPDEWIISRKSAHPALVSEADFIATRRYLLARLLVCGPRMESAWSNGKPAYRCRHGHTTARGRGRLTNAYIREDRNLPHLAALHLLLTQPAAGPRRRRTLGSRIPVGRSR